jgi:hypothetical protein
MTYNIDTARKDFHKSGCQEIERMSRAYDTLNERIKFFSIKHPHLVHLLERDRERLSSVMLENILNWGSNSFDSFKKLKIRRGVVDMTKNPRERRTLEVEEITFDEWLGEKHLSLFFKTYYPGELEDLQRFFCGY